MNGGDGNNIIWERTSSGIVLLDKLILSGFSSEVVHLRLSIAYISTYVEIKMALAEFFILHRFEVSLLQIKI